MELSASGRRRLRPPPLNTTAPAPNSVSSEAIPVAEAYANFKSIKSMHRAIFASRVAPAIENAGGTESIDKYRARRTFESCGELGGFFFCAASSAELPGAPRCRLARYASKGILKHLHTVLAQCADAGLPTASAAAAVPAATSHRQVECFTRPGRSKLAPRSPRIAAHVTGSGGIYTRLSRLAGRTATQ